MDDMRVPDRMQNVRRHDDDDGDGDDYVMAIMVTMMFLMLKIAMLMICLRWTGSNICMPPR